MRTRRIDGAVPWQRLRERVERAGPAHGARRTVREQIVKAAALLATGLALPALAEPPAAVRHDVSIEPQPIATALKALAAQTGLQLLVLTQDAANKRSPAVHGSLTTEEALSRILDDSGLTYQKLDDNTVAVRKLDVGRAPKAALHATSYKDFGPAADQSLRDSQLQAQAGPEQSVLPAGTSQAGDDTRPQSLGQVVVTGSRVVTNGADAPTPVTAISSEQLTAGAPTSLVDGLSQLPQLMNTTGPQSSGVITTAAAGQSFIGLRSLTPSRTLVLLDGSRVVPSGLTAVTDVSLFPENLVKRVDVVTGGASAVYGSDAVAGVVNFVLDTKFSGFKADIQGGESGHQDDRNGKLELAGGADFAGGRGHFVASAEIYKNNGVDDYSRRSWYDACALISNPASPPAYVPACNVHSSSFTWGGMIPSGPLAGTQFGAGGVPEPFSYGTQRTGASMVGGSPAAAGVADVGEFFQPVPDLKRQNFFGRADYKVTDNISAYAQLLAAQSEDWYVGTYPWQGNATNGYTIQADNAFLPASIATAMKDNGVSSFPFYRYDEDFGPLLVRAKNDTYEVKAGIDALFGQWTLKAYYQHGENNAHVSVANNPIVNNEYQAADAVVNPATGQVVCRSSLTQPNNGCVPINLFGYGSPSAEAISYVTGTAWAQIHAIEDVAEASVSAQPFNLWAGPVSVAFGSGYRRESATQTADPISQDYKTAPVAGQPGYYTGFPSALDGILGGFDRGNYQPAAGWYNLWELFGETEVPLARNLPGAQELDFNGAVRYTNYSTTGGVTSWKAGLTWQPVDDLRFRAAQSRDIRAPNVNEMYSGRTQTQGNVIDDFKGASSTPVTVYTIALGGGSGLKPEKADTTTYGFVFTPAFVPRLTVSLDRYQIRIDDAITSLSGQQTVDQCFAGSTQLCSNIIRVNGEISQVMLPYMNIGSARTAGEDLEINYPVHLSGLLPAVGGDLDLRVVGNHTDDLIQQVQGSPPVEWAGQTGTTQTGLMGGVPHWSGNVVLQYTNNPYSVFLQERLIGSGTLNNTYGPAQLAPQYNRVGGVAYTDLTLGYDFSVKGVASHVFFTVNNLFDRAPPAAPQPYFVFGTGGGGVNGSMFDVIGRLYTLGLKVNFR